MGQFFANWPWATIAIAFHIASRLAYVVGVGSALNLEKRRRWFTRARGTEAGFRRFRRLAATVMNNDAVSFALACWLTRETLAIPVARPVLVAVGGAAILAGASIKLWARAAVGGGGAGYYWRDFFDAQVPPPGKPGPYRYLKNPMYTLGYLHAYGLALALASLPGLVLAVFDQLAILAFYRIVEKPHFDQLLPRQGARTRG
ncbi:MAG: PEMT/PEM2 family methyltransferase [Gemmatimonadales bacterium]